jgi:hypothetical protein
VLAGCLARRPRTVHKGAVAGVIENSPADLAL